MDFIYFLDLFGVLVFAISGVLTAVEKKFDLVGSVVIGFVTALGGGTIRDLLIGETPVGWMKDMNYLYMLVPALILCFFFRKYIMKLRRSLFLFDTLGIGVFTILGMQKTLEAGLHPIIAVMMGVVSAVFGGVTRDVLTNEVPLIFRKEIYATACVAGAIVFGVLDYFNPDQWYNLIPAIFSIFIIRYFSVKNGWMIAFKPIK
jgi:uncharacterized membrane protein YeiH